VSISFFVQGYPFRERIQDNKTLYYGLLSVGGIALAGATEFFPEINEQLKLVKFPSAVSTWLSIDYEMANYV
jgi:cation-transporting ATPase 13A1